MGRFVIQDGYRIKEAGIHAKTSFDASAPPEALAGPARLGTPGVHRRDLDQNRHGGAARPGGQRLAGFAPHGHWRARTFLAALRRDRLTPPRLFDGPINGARFPAYAEQQPVRTLNDGYDPNQNGKL